MRYISHPAAEAYEAQYIPRNFGKFYAPHGPVTVGPDGVLDTAGVELVDLASETLAIRPHTASWSFLNPAEATFYNELAGKSVGWLVGRWPRDAHTSLESFVGHLYRRGLLSIHGSWSIDPTIFDDSPNTPDSHLVELLVTENCNLGCKYCLAGAKPGKPTMTQEMAERAVDLAFGMTEADSLTFEFAGGEPFLQFKLMKYVTGYIRTHPLRHGRTVHMLVQTNATLLNEERVRWLQGNDVHIGVSLDGDPASHNLSRPQVNGEESFSKVLQGLKLLQRYQVPFSALMVLNRSNVGSVQALIDFLLDHGLSSFKLNPMAYLGTGRETWDQLGITQEEVVHYFQSLARYLVQHGYPLIEANLAAMLKHVVSKQRGTRCMRTHCGAGQTFQAVNSRGDIFPCGRSTQTPAMVLGNVLTEGVSLSQPARSNRFIQEINQRRPRDLEGCSACPYQQLCQAGCSVEAYERYGTVRHRTPECHFYKTMYPFLMRWLSFDPNAVRFFHETGYFGNGGQLVSFDHLPYAGARKAPQGH